ncbi:MAG: sigma-54 dependent transcriptional regulator [Candidatus Sumerlaeaceae bacterium]|nr:sigma-54 dependent transcriptional regulator [Candidatus Sumerlaeaceae bacterium]
MTEFTDISSSRLQAIDASLGESRPRILVADDEESMRFVLRQAMQKEGYEVDIATNGMEVVQKVRETHFDLVIMDIKMPQLDGLEALKEIKKVRPELIVVMATAHGTTQIALDAIKKGAYDYFSKPFELDEMRIVIRRALEKQRLQQTIGMLQNQLRERLSFDRIVGQSDTMRKVYELVEKVITNDVTVLITGESGTGKELVAQAVHYNSARKSQPFVSVNCAAIPETLLESELFGHEKGAFTGATGTRLGKFEVANNGTIFLDEIGDMPLSLQSKMLRVLQEHEITRVGGNRPIRVNIRVVAATNQNLGKLVEDKLFREDLYFRLNVVPILLPALRQRVSDIPLLAWHFIERYNPRLGKNITGISHDAMELLLGHSWPGNVRELENVIQRAMVLATSTTIDVTDLPSNIHASAMATSDGGPARAIDPSLVSDFSIPLQQKLDRLSEELERKIIAAALQQANFHRQATADLLGISRKSLHNKMVKYNMFEGRTED